jgi:hypothetical protein
MRKKSAKLAAQAFKTGSQEIRDFLTAIKSAGHTDSHETWAYDYAIIRTYREFEDLILSCLVAAINNDSTQLTETTKVAFPTHLNQDVCEYVITKGGYFDFKGRGGLIQVLKKYLPSNHYLIEIVKKDKYKTTLDRLSAFRNFAAHDSKQSKKAALESIDNDAKRLSASGAWLKKQDRMESILDKLDEIADEVEQDAPY